MKRFACALVFVAIFATGCGSSTAPATVNGVAIDRSEYLDQLAQLVKLNGEGEANATAEQRSSLLTQRIVAALVADEVGRLGLTITDADMATAREEIGAIPEGISESFYDYVVRVQAQQNVLVARITDANAPWYSDADIRNFYNSVKDTKYVNFCTHHILVDSEADANEILGLLKNGGDFAQLASQRSTDTESGADGGDLGCNAKGSFVPEFEDAVLAATAGSTIGPVKSTYGYHVIRVDKEYGVQPFDDTMRQTISASFLNEAGWLTWKTYSSNIKVNKKFGSWSNEEGSVIPPADPTVK